MAKFVLPRSHPRARGCCRGSPHPLGGTRGEGMGGTDFPCSPRWDAGLGEQGNTCRGSPAPLGGTRGEGMGGSSGTRGEGMGGCPVFVPLLPSVGRGARDGGSWDINCPNSPRNQTDTES